MRTLSQESLRSMIVTFQRVQCSTAETATARPPVTETARSPPTWTLTWTPDAIAGGTTVGAEGLPQMGRARTGDRPPPPRRPEGPKWPGFVTSVETLSPCPVSDSVVNVVSRGSTVKIFFPFCTLRSHNAPYFWTTSYRGGQSFSYGKWQGSHTKKIKVKQNETNHINVSRVICVTIHSSFSYQVVNLLTQNQSLSCKTNQ